MTDNALATTEPGRRRIGRLLAAGVTVALSALVLSGCVGAVSSSRPSAASAGVPRSDQPAASLPPSPGNQPSTAATLPTAAVITMADDGKTRFFALDQQFTLALGADLDWAVKVADERIVKPVAGVSLPAGAQGVYEAHTQGSTTLSASGRARCTPGDQCPLFIIAFSVTIVVG